MTNSDYPRLCGGTFFILVLQALRQRMKAREHYKGESDGLKDPNVLVGLIRVINPDYREPAGDALKGKTNDFKSCKISTGQYLPFGNTPDIEEFDKRVRETYSDALSAMTGFVERFLEVGTAVKKDERLVKALIDLVQQDESIGEDECFYVLEGGGKIKKAALGDLTAVCLPAFLLGVWHYVVVYRKDNKVGQETYNQWCPSNGGGPRTYSGDMGKDLNQEISIFTTGVTEEAAAEESTIHDHSTDTVLAALRNDYKAILIYCIENDPCAGPTLISLPDEIMAANSKWKYTWREIEDAKLRKLAYDIMETLNEYSVYLSDTYLRLIPGTNTLWFRNESWEEGCRLRDDMLPNTAKIRQKIADLYCRLYPVPEDGEEAATCTDEQAQSTQGAASVQNNNPLFIQQNGDGNVVMPNYGTITINFGKK